MPWEAASPIHEAPTVRPYVSPGHRPEKPHHRFTKHQRCGPMSAQGIALGNRITDSRSTNGAALIPNVSFIDLQTVSLTEFSELLLERQFLVMLLLIFDVPPNIHNIRFANRKCSIAHLP